MSDLSYFIEIMDPFGETGAMDTFTALDYVRTINDVGVLTMDLPVDGPHRYSARMRGWPCGANRPAGHINWKREQSGSWRRGGGR
jgi:hypothetical protein